MGIFLMQILLSVLFEIIGMLLDFSWEVVGFVNNKGHSLIESVLMFSLCVFLIGVLVQTVRAVYQLKTLSQNNRDEIYVEGYQ